MKSAKHSTITITIKKNISKTSFVNRFFNSPISAFSGVGEASTKNTRASKNPHKNQITSEHLALSGKSAKTASLEGLPICL